MNVKHWFIPFAMALLLLTGCLPPEVNKPLEDQSSSPNISDPPSSSRPPALPDSHPVPTAPTLKIESIKKGPLVHRDYIAALLFEIFQSTVYSNNVENIIYAYGLNQVSQLGKPNVFGLACDTYGSAGSLDCAGDVGAGSVAVIMTEATPVRQLSKLKLCEQIVSMTNSPKAAAEKIGLVANNNVAEITDENLPLIFSLFFRGREITSRELAAYSQFNRSLKEVFAASGASTSANLTNRWRAILVMLCESPEWEVL